MARWIYQAREERDKEKQRQERFARVFPTAAGSLWEQLCHMIGEQLRILREVHPDIISSETQMNRQPHSLRIEYTDQFPHYFLCLALNIQDQEITAQQIIKNDPAKCSPPNVLAFLLCLDEHTQMLKITLNGKTLSLEEVVELCLRPILDLHPVDIINIRG